MKKIQDFLDWLRQPERGRKPIIWLTCTKNGMKIIEDKKVLLRERKRHTAHRVAVASACYSGGGYYGYPPTWDGITPLPGPGMGYPPYLDLGWGTPPPTRAWDGVPPYLDLGWGTPPT